MARKESMIIKPHPNDILCCGREGDDLKNQNGWFHRLIHGNRTLYRTRPNKRTKLMVAEAIVRVVHQQEPPGRFLILENKQQGLWKEIPYKLAVKKTSQELQPEKKKRTSSSPKSSAVVREQQQKHKKKITAAVAPIPTVSPNPLPLPSSSSSLSSTNTFPVMPKLMDHELFPLLQAPSSSAAAFAAMPKMTDPLPLPFQHDGNIEILPLLEKDALQFLSSLL